ncbi:AraC family transcriptional regulator [Paenibacillus spiritus]|uniref:AraC family transcriptional regulator n=1 Tax=Paenibacillus spiritus TaxID=2496557 RepID=A0A5J5GBM2_9BACL|nr:MULTISPECIES: AraC family transcriptional regulator [Paenibacillus]KAA9005401.1 AraC family transcriptional regulator [Paenibacillus spiritus]
MKAYHENRSYNSTLPFTPMLLRNFSFLAHWHNDLEFMYVAEGSIRAGVNSESRLLRQGDMAISCSGDIHYYDSRGLESTILIIVFNPRLIGYPGGWPQEVRLSSPFVESSGKPPESPEALLSAAAHDRITRMKLEAEERPPHYELLITGLLYELCGLILRSIGSKPAEPGRDRRLGTGLTAMQGALDYLEKHYSAPVTLDEAAREAGMSRFHFSRFFKNATGLSFVSYLNHIRVNKAEELILHTNRTLTDIALECGFTNVRTFNRVFRQFRGQTPSSLRR